MNMNVKIKLSLIIVILQLFCTAGNSYVFLKANPKGVANQRTPFCCFKSGIAKHGFGNYVNLFDDRAQKMIVSSNHDVNSWDGDNYCGQVNMNLGNLVRCKTIVFGRSVAMDGTSYIDFANHFKLLAHEPLNQFSLGFSPLLTYVNYIPRFIDNVVFRTSNAIDISINDNLKNKLDQFLNNCANDFAFSCVEIYFVACKTNKNMIVVTKETTDFKLSASLPPTLIYNRNDPLSFCAQHQTAPWTAKTLNDYNIGALNWVSQMPSDILPNLFKTPNDQSFKVDFETKVSNNLDELSKIDHFDNEGQPVKKVKFIGLRYN